MQMQEPLREHKRWRIDDTAVSQSVSGLVLLRRIDRWIAMDNNGLHIDPDSGAVTTVRSNTLRLFDEVSGDFMWGPEAGLIWTSRKVNKVARYLTDETCLLDIRALVADKSSAAPREPTFHSKSYTKQVLLDRNQKPLFCLLASFLAISFLFFSVWIATLTGSSRSSDSSTMSDPCLHFRCQMTSHQ